MSWLMLRGGSSQAWMAAMVALPLCGSAVAQSAGTNPVREDPASFGSVSGHVYLAGSNVPARLVRVNLQPLQAAESEPQFAAGKPVAMPYTIYQTGLDGSYTIPHVRPGVYYVVVTAPGFLSPFSSFTAEELKHPTPDVAHRIAALLPVISVRPNATSMHDVSLQQGAALSGSVLFDDGTPFFEGDLAVQRKNAEGKWQALHGYSERPLIDTEGHWKITGLPAGEYRLQVKLTLNDRKQSSGFLQSSASSSYTHYAVEYYLGDTAHVKDAKTIKLEDGEARAGVDVTIPVSKLHAISGAVVDSGTGQALNAGHVSLLYASDGQQIASTDVDPESRTFTFPWVPEGEYRLHVDKAGEAHFQPAPEADPNFPERNQKVLFDRRYQSAEMPLIVQSDATGVSVAVNPASGAP